MLNPDFDPLKTLEDMAHNQQILFNNDQNLAQSIKDLMLRLEQQQLIIDQLLVQVKNTSTANEILLEGFLKEINKSIKDMKWPNQ